MAKRRYAPSTFFSSKRQHTMMLAAAYYAILNEDQCFRAALRYLYDGFHLSAWRDPTVDELELLQSFAAQWHLSDEYGLGDLWESNFHVFDPFDDEYTEPPVLIIGQPWPEIVPCWASGELPKLSVARELREGGEGNVDTYIYPYQPEPFHYTPYHMSTKSVREHADAIAAKVRDSIIEQALDLERRAEERGWSLTPAQHRNTDVLRRVAKRLYRRAVLRWTWRAIAQAEYPPDCVPQEPPTRAVRKSVESWARLLGIHLR